MPTGPRKARPDDRLSIEPGIQGFPRCAIAYLRSGAGAPSRNDCLGLLRRFAARNDDKYGLFRWLPFESHIKDLTMTFQKSRDALRLILTGSRCIRPGSVYDAISIRIAEDLGFELGMFGGSVASLAVLGDPDVTLITLTELAEQMHRMSRAAALPVLVDADHGYGNALNVRRTVQELEVAGAAGLTIEDTLLPQAFGEAKTQLISLEEGVGKMKAALDGRGDPSLVIVGRTGAASVSGVEDAIARARAYEAAGVDALFFTGLKTRAELEAIAAATTLPIV